MTFNFYSIQCGGVAGESVNALFRARTGTDGNITSNCMIRIKPVVVQDWSLF